MTYHKNHLTDLGTDARLRFMLVYQVGIANVFRVECANLAPDGRNALRVYQGDFKTGEAIARGAGIAGAIVHTAACNQVGDISDATWTDDLEAQPFSEKFHPVFFTLGY
jgi:hypothetical protein